MNQEEHDTLHLALIQAVSGKFEEVKVLIKSGADVNGMPLIRAIQCEEPEIVKLLLKAGAKVNLHYNRTTPLITAITVSNPEIVRILLQAGAHVDQVDAEARLPLHVAMEEQRRVDIPQAVKDEIVNLLKAAGAHDYLHVALIQAADGYPEDVRELIEAGADVNGMPLIMAIQCEELEIVKLLLEAGSKINLICRGTTPLIHAIKSSCLDIMVVLINAGADVNFPDYQGELPLQAAMTGQRCLDVSQEVKDEIIERLKAAGAKEQ